MNLYPHYYWIEVLKMDGKRWSSLAFFFVSNCSYPNIQQWYFYTRHCCIFRLGSTRMMYLDLFKNSLNSVIDKYCFLDHSLSEISQALQLLCTQAKKWKKSFINKTSFYYFSKSSSVHNFFLQWRATSLWQFSSFKIYTHLRFILWSICVTCIDEVGSMLVWIDHETPNVTF